jgi:hypothetical protein
VLHLARALIDCGMLSQTFDPKTQIENRVSVQIPMKLSQRMLMTIQNKKGFSRTPNGSWILQLLRDLGNGLKSKDLENTLKGGNIL